LVLLGHDFIVIASNRSTVRRNEAVWPSLTADYGSSTSFPLFPRSTCLTKALDHFANWIGSAVHIEPGGHLQLFWKSTSFTVSKCWHGAFRLWHGVNLDVIDRLL